MNPRPPSHVIPHPRPSHHGNANWQNGAHNARNNWNNFRQHHGDWAGRVGGYRHNWEGRYLGGARNRWNNFRGYYHNNTYRYYYSNWFQYGFFGGYYYPVRPCFEIGAYFEYPLVQWFYVETPDPGYYQQWYGDDYQQYPIDPNPYVEIFFPTDVWRDALVALSGLSAEQQASFRQGILNVTSWMRDGAAAILNDPNFQFQQYDIVVNSYTNLQDQAIVLEGFVDRDNGSIHLPFKVLVDLLDPDQSQVFLPSSDQPTADELNQLQALNDRIRSLGGDPFTANDEPENVQQGDDQVPPPIDDNAPATDNNPPPVGTDL